MAQLEYSDIEALEKEQQRDEIKSYAFWVAFVVFGTFLGRLIASGFYKTKVPGEENALDRISAYMMFSGFVVDFFYVPVIGFIAGRFCSLDARPRLVIGGVIVSLIHFFGVYGIDMINRATPMMIAMYGGLLFGGWKVGDLLRERKHRIQL